MDKSSLLIVYPVAHHHTAVERLASEMKQKGLCVDVCCLYSRRRIQESNIRWPFYLFVCIWFLEHRVFLVNKLVIHFIMEYALKGLVKRYNYVDFHYYCPAYDRSISYCIKHHIKYDITLWGSDLLRVSKRRLMRMKVGFSSAHSIKGAKGLLNTVSELYNGSFDKKLRYADFGNSMFDYIDSIDNEYEAKYKKILFPNSEGKIIISCGYNAIPQQQHLQIIEQLNQLPPCLKERIYVSLLFSYGIKHNYYQKVKEAIDKSGITYSFIDFFLKPKEMAVFRKNVDVVINMQETDAFSFSIQEHLYAGSILILGEWLSYEELKNSSVNYIESSLTNIYKNIEDVIKHLGMYKRKCENNKIMMSNIISWKAMSDLWYNSYII